jgi:hypothetical protein
MSIRKRLLRIFAILSLVVLFAGYFAFSTFLFSPLEGDLEADVSTLVPRDVDFFIAKAQLSKDFAPFPRPVLIEALQPTFGWHTFEESETYAQWAARVEAPVQQIEQIRSQLRGLDLLDIFGGRDLALAGYFRGARLADADWAAYGRVNWAGKLAVGLLRYPALIGLSKQGLSAAVQGDAVTLSGQGIVRPLTIVRVRDVAIIGTSPELVAAAAQLHAQQGQDSFGLSARYFDHIENAERSPERNEVEAFVDLRTMAENLRFSGRWPNPASQDLVPAFAGKLFQLGSVKEVVGVVGFQGGASADLHGEFSSELISAEQNRIYRIKGFERADFMDSAANLAQADASWLLFVHSDIGELLRQLINSFEPATRELIEDSVRSLGEYQSTAELITEFQSLFKNRLVVVARDNDYRYTDSDPPNDGLPVPAIAVVLWIERADKAADRIQEIERLITQNQQKFGIRGRNPGEQGVFTNTVSGGYQVREYWNPLVPGTGHLTTVRVGDLFIVSNTFKMLEQVLKTYIEGSPNYPRLAERPDFRALAASSLPQANVGLWLNPRALSPLLRKQAGRRAEQEASMAVDWRTERLRLEDSFLRERYPGVNRNNLTPEIQAALDAHVTPILEERRDKLSEQQIPALRAGYERQVTYSEMVSSSLLLLALDPKGFQLSLRAIVPLDDWPPTP